MKRRIPEAVLSRSLMQWAEPGGGGGGGVYSESNASITFLSLCKSQDYVLRAVALVVRWPPRVRMTPLSVLSVLIGSSPPRFPKTTVFHAAFNWRCWEVEIGTYSCPLASTPQHSFLLKKQDPCTLLQPHLRVFQHIPRRYSYRYVSQLDFPDDSCFWAAVDAQLSLEG